MLCLALAPAAIPAATGRAQAEELPIRVDRIERFDIGDARSRFGPLTFRGGLVLAAPRGFGGLSGLEVDDDGAGLVAVSDLGHWFTATLETDADGRLTGLTDARWFARLGEAGRPITRKREADAEALALRRSGARPLLVAVEEQPFLLAYPLPPTADGAPERVGLPNAVAAAVARHGTESLAVAPPQPGGPPGETLFIATEHAPRQGSGAWLVRDGRAAPLPLYRGPEWAITGADFLPDGDLVLLERRFRRPIWVGMRIRRIARQELRSRGPVRGSVLIEADLSHEIDNMEGIAAHRDARGRTFLTLVSDDNRNLLQRNLILRFELEAPRPRRRPLAAPAATR